VQRVDEQPWPAQRCASWQLSGLPGTLGLARGHARAFLEAATPAPDASTLHDALVVVAELVSNAVRHAPGPCVLELTQDGALLRIAVGDTSSSPPVPRVADLTAGGGGFGWHLLHSIADRVDVRPRGGLGKTVTATVTLLTG
jgi:anti-sigma regulatory factor (Ser/Thr protein kinase)